MPLLSNLDPDLIFVNNQKFKISKIYSTRQSNMTIYFVELCVLLVNFELILKILMSISMRFKYGHIISKMINITHRANN